MIVQCNVKSTTQFTIYKHNVRYKLHYNAVACLVVTERQVAEGEQQTEILSVNGKPSEYRSLNIHYTMSVFVKTVFFKS